MVQGWFIKSAGNEVGWARFLCPRGSLKAGTNINNLID